MTDFGPTQLRELTDIIEEFRRSFGSGRYRFTAHFVPNVAVARDTVYIMDLKPLHLAGAPPELLRDPPNIDVEKDYGVAIHPDTLLLLRAEFHQAYTHTQLTDNEIAVILVAGNLDSQKRPRRRSHGIIDTSGS